MNARQVKRLMEMIDENRHLFEVFQRAVVVYFERHPKLSASSSIVHSIRSRIKSPESIRDKFERKKAEGPPITEENLFKRITDIAGVRVLHLCQQDFPVIHACIMDQIQRGDWVLDEEPKAYTWDPESKGFFVGCGLEVHVKESFYTSIHYVVRPRKDSEVACEIQVRTLFEEIWGEIDHQVNYPSPTESLACREQLRVLARLVGAGSRLADAIYRVHRDDVARGIV